jgi:hypothetical protein
LNSKRVRVVALVVCLVLLASLLGAVSGGLTPPLSKAIQKLPFVTQTVTSTSGVSDAGEIVIDASLGVPGFAPVPIPNATVNLIPISTGFSSGKLPVDTETNASGIAEKQVLVGNYTLKVFDQIFSTSVGVEVLPNATTTDDLTVLKTSDQVVFSDLSDEDSAGSVAPWQSVTLAVSGSTPISNSSAYYLDIVYEQFGGGPGGTVMRQEDVIGVAMESSQTFAYGNGSGLIWLTLRPVAFVPTSNMTSLSLVTFAAVTRISYHGH